jgi:hypothetical protein
MKEKSFIPLTPGDNAVKLFICLKRGQSKLDRLYAANIFIGLIFVSKSGAYSKSGAHYWCHDTQHNGIQQDDTQLNNK